jgi:glycosyltransferase involved in cell wall biosynthesis
MLSPLSETKKDAITNNKIKICYIINNLSQGGAERQLIELIRNIDKAKFDITICLYAVNKGIFFKSVFDIRAINIVQNVLKKRVRILKITEALLFIRRLLKSNSYDILHTILFMNGLFVRLVAPRKYDNRIITCIRTSLSNYKRSFLVLEKMLICRSYVIANSRSAAERLKALVSPRYSKRIRYIYNGYDTHVFNPRHVEKNKGEILIGCVGRIYHIKNQIQVVRVVHSLNIANLRLIIVGSSGDQEKIIKSYIQESKLQNSIAVLPAQNNIQDYYNRFDIFVLPSLLEGCPNVLFEAMLSKCFCIISKNANSDGFVEPGVNGLVYNGNDAALKNQIQYAISIMNSAKYNEIRENGYNYAIENFSMKKMVESYEKFYFEILNGKKN